MEGQGIFKTSTFGGFDKQSVLNYVDEITIKAKKQESILTDRMNTLSEERGRYIADLFTCQKDLEANVQRVQELEAELAQTKGHAADLHTQITQMQEMLDVLQAGEERAAEKERKYQATAAQVGVVMVEAQNQADTIIARAHQEADRIAQDALDNIFNINKRLDQVQNDTQNLRLFATKTFQQFETQMEQIDLLIKQTEGGLYINAGKLGNNHVECMGHDVRQKNFTDDKSRRHEGTLAQS